MNAEGVGVPGLNLRSIYKLRYSTTPYRRTEREFRRKSIGSSVQNGGCTTGGFGDDHNFGRQKMTCEGMVC